MAPLVILLFCLGLAAGRFPGISDESHPHLEDALLRLLQKLRQDEFFDTLLIYGSDCVFHSLSKHLEVSTVLASLGTTQSDWEFSTLTMILCCGSDAEFEKNERTIMKLQRNRRLIYIAEDIQPGSVCSDYFAGEAYNTAIVREDFGESSTIYACRPFQEPNYEEVSLWEAKPIYIENFRNMQERPITTMVDLMPPRCMVYEDKRTGKEELIGYVANLLKNFAQRVNATLVSYELPQNLDMRIILWSVRNDKLDMGMTLERYVLPESLETASYPYMLAPYCAMLQVPAKLPHSQVYGMILAPLVLGIFFVLFCILSVLLIYSRKKSWRELNFTNVLLNDVSLRGLLGQSFPFPPNASRHLRLIFIILCFASIMLTTMYNAYLQSFFTHPPSETPIRSFRDLTKFNKKLATSEPEYTEMMWTNNSRFQEISENDMVIIDNYRDYLKIRDSLNQSYNYFVTGDHWTTYEEQQKMFKEPAFYFSDDLCLSHLMHIAIPVRRLLPHRHLFDEHIMSQNEFGLTGYWRSHGFFDMVRMGLTPLIPKDLKQPKASDSSLTLKDISWALELYLAAMVFSILCFFLEVLSTKKRIRRWWRGMGKCYKGRISKICGKPTINL